MGKCLVIEDFTGASIIVSSGTETERERDTSKLHEEKNKCYITLLYAILIEIASTSFTLILIFNFFFYCQWGVYFDLQAGVIRIARSSNNC